MSSLPARSALAVTAKDHDQGGHRNPRIAIPTRTQLASRASGLSYRWIPQDQIIIRRETSQRARSALASAQASRRARDARTSSDEQHGTTAGQSIGTDGAVTTQDLSAAQRDRWFAIMKSMPLAGFERLMADVGLHDLNLDVLIGVVTGQQVVKSLLSKESASLVETRPMPSYLHFIPSRYGQGTCLDDTIKCITSKIKSMLATTCDDNHPKKLVLYGKALRSVQSAIRSESWADPEVLRAIITLSHYEILEGNTRSWAQHIFGVSRLIRARGPSRFHTEFEKVILSPILGWIIYESLVFRQPAYLDDPSWLPVLQSMTGPNPSDRQQIVSLLVSLGIRVARLLIEVHDAICKRTTLSENDMDHLESRCRVLKADLVKWRDDSDPYITASVPLGGLATVGDARAEMMSAGCVLQAASCRLVSAVSPEDRITEEQEALELTHYITRVQNTVGWDSVVQFHFEQRTDFTDSILATTDIWLEGCTEAVGAEPEPDGETRGKKRLIESYKFQAWRNAMPGGKRC